MASIQTKIKSPHHRRSVPGGTCLSVDTRQQRAAQPPLARTQAPSPDVFLLPALGWDQSTPSLMDTGLHTWADQ